jgi:hypothetical protein
MKTVTICNQSFRAFDVPNHDLSNYLNPQQRMSEGGGSVHLNLPQLRVSVKKTLHTALKTVQDSSFGFLKTETNSSFKISPIFKSKT